TRLTMSATCHGSPARGFGAPCFLLLPGGEAASKCTSVQAQCAVEIGGQCDPTTGRWFYGRHMGALPGRTTGASPTAFRPRCVEGASDGKLLVGFTVDGRCFVPILVLLVFFFLVIIIVGMSRRHRVTAHDGDETPNVLRGPWSHFRLLCGCRVSWRC